MVREGGTGTPLNCMYSIDGGSTNEKNSLLHTSDPMLQI